MTKLEYTFKNDILVKMLFAVKYPDLLKRLVAVLLGIRYESTVGKGLNVISLVR